MEHFIGKQVRDMMVTDGKDEGEPHKGPAMAMVHISADSTKKDVREEKQCQKASCSTVGGNIAQSSDERSHNTPTVQTEKHKETC